jgi:UPF0716 family protein affecting phage T7 exclusion
MKNFLGSQKIIVLLITIILFEISYFIGIANVIIYTLGLMILLVLAALIFYRYKVIMSSPDQLEQHETKKGK